METEIKGCNLKRESRCNQKMKILYLMKILLEETDEEHDITLAEIIEKLKCYGVTAERKSIYSDIEHLRLFGMDIITTQYDRTHHYQVINRMFELAEMKLLVDSVESAKFITEKKSKELIKKLENYVSRHEALKLDRQVNISGRVKTVNERIYYSIDAIYEALNSDRQIKFQYFVWNVDKKMELKRNGAYYSVSPWAMCWDDEKYYLIGYDNDEQKIKHFRVDKMSSTSVESARRVGKEKFKKICMSEYTSRLFGMFDGETEIVRLYCENNVANIMIDRFGIDVPLIKVDAEHFEISVKVSVSKIFLGWVMALQGVKIISPENVVEMMKTEIRRLQGIYCL